ncbi:hypothetical protein A9K55_005974 [Cordyceps militaris]|uniref:Uncharacterized protein n=1 Tax=Cordyceps militaris TaxID=73501 RepID=A0A2H4SD62_CORMI|nr:hypothetical protein A9K55_005974 [Cordyceps militaris]
MSRPDIQSHPPWRGHFYLPFECGLCAGPVKRHSLAYALVSTPDSMNLQEITRPFVFPHGATGSGGTEPDDGEPVVRIGDWAVGARFNVEPEPPGRCVECTVIHADCFHLYKACTGHNQDASQASQASRYVWFLGLWRQPWNRTKTLQGIRPLPREKFMCSKSAISYILNKVGLSDFVMRLPWEIVSYIFEFSKDAPLWKAARAATVAFERRHDGVDGYTLVPALEIASWKRGHSSPELRGPSDKTKQLTRFTIDSQGLRRIERIDKPSSLQPSHVSKDREYIVAEEEELQSVQLIFKRGRARLHTPDGHPGFTTWDMPLPPPKPSSSAGLRDDMSHWVKDGAPLSRFCGQQVSASRFQTAYLEGATGITFVFHNTFLAHIAAHNPRNPLAQLPYDTDVLEEVGGSPMEEFSELAWTYVPLPPGDKILSIGFSTDGWQQRIVRPGMMIHTKLAGTLFVGFLMPLRSPYIPLGEEPELLFTRLQAPFVSGVGAYSSKPVSEFLYSEKIRNFPREMTFGQPDPFKLTSFAPLDDLVRLDIVEEPTAGVLRGLMLYYTNGAQRVVGQYRIGHHQLRTYMQPKCLCLKYDPQQGTIPVRQLVRATASPSCEEGHESHTRRQGFACFRLTGFIRAEFDFDTISLRFADRDSKLAVPIAARREHVALDG